MFLNPTNDKIDEVLRKYVDNYNRKYEIYEVRCLLKLLTLTDRVRFIEISSRSKSHHSFCFPKN